MIIVNLPKDNCHSNSKCTSGGFIKVFEGSPGSNLLHFHAVFGKFCKIVQNYLLLSVWEMLDLEYIYPFDG